MQRVAEELGENLTDEELQAGFPTPNSPILRPHNAKRAE